jgi:deazaflavin-dependent oxidoreductase (nitroreductase family)
VKHRVVRLLQTKLINPMVRGSAGLPGSRYAILETIGRKTGQPRQTPVGNGLDGDVFWIVSEHGRHAFYVRNLIANPRVRVKVDGAWRTGVAHLVPDDDPLTRLKQLDPRTAAEVRRMGSSLLSVRVDLDR